VPGDEFGPLDCHLGIKLCVFPNGIKMWEFVLLLKAAMASTMDKSGSLVMVTGKAGVPVFIMR